jgi:hypothetical protein
MFYHPSYKLTLSTAQAIPLFQIELSLWISEQIAVPPPLINSGGI